MKITTRRWIAAAALASFGYMLQPTPGAVGLSSPGSFDTNLAKGTAYGAEGLLEHSGNPPLVIKPLVEVGKVATQNIPCNATSGTTYKNEVASIDLGLPSGQSIVKTGKVVNTTKPTFDANFADSTVNSTIDNVNLLGGVIQATALSATSQTTYNSDGVNKHTTVDEFTADDEGSGVVFTSLTINGETQESSPEPNTEIPLDGIGRVILNEQLLIPHPKIRVAPGVRQTPGLIVNAIHVYVDNLGGWEGDFLVGHADSHIREAVARVSGYAFASQLRVDPPLMSGRQSVIYLPCVGTKGNVLTLNGVGGTIFPGVPGSGLSTVASTAATHSTVQANVPAVLTASDPAYSESTETIESLRLFVDEGTGDPLISADAIKTVARTEGVSNVQSTGTVEVVNLVLPGADEPITGPIDPNTKIDIPGVGFVRFNEQKCSGAPEGGGLCTQSTYGQITVYAVHIKVTDETNDLGLPVGAEIWIGVAKSDVRI